MVLQGVKGGLGEGKRGGLSTEAEPNSEAVPQGARVEAVSPLPQGIRRGPCGLWEPVGCGEPEESSGGVSLSQEESRPEGRRHLRTKAVYHLPGLGRELKARGPEPNLTGSYLKRHLGQAPELLNSLCLHPPPAPSTPASWTCMEKANPATLTPIPTPSG